MSARFFFGVCVTAVLSIASDATATPPTQGVAVRQPTGCRFASIDNAGGAYASQTMVINGCAFGAQVGLITIAGAFPQNGNNFALSAVKWTDTQLIAMVPAIRGALSQTAQLSVRTAAGQESASYPVTFIPATEDIEFDPGKGKVTVVCSTASSNDKCPAAIPGNVAMRGEHQSYIGRGPSGQDDYTFALKNGWHVISVKTDLEKANEGGYITTSVHPVENTISVYWTIGGIAWIRYQGVVTIRGPAGVPY
jgi:hypothetical protein